MTGERLLLVDDEPNIVALARMYLEQEGFVVESASDGEEALEQIERDPPDAVILDLMLPKVDGWEVCRRIRARSDLPIIMLTARDDPVDKVVGLELGADAYLTKPFHPRELVAWVKAVLRRAAPRAIEEAQAERVIEVGNLRVDLEGREVYIGGERVPLRAKEFDLLVALLRYRNQVLTREQLLDLVWGYTFEGQSRTVDVHVAHLRRKLASCVEVAIETVWGVGYKLVVAGG